MSFNFFKNKFSGSNKYANLKKALNNSDQYARLISNSIEFLRTGKKWRDDEVKLLDEIAHLRSELEKNTEKIQVVDFGAGKSSDQKSQKEMEEGFRESRVIGEICQIAASPKKWGELIFKLIIDFKPKNCLELGTNLGISACYQLAGLKLNNAGQLTTLEGSPEIANVAIKNFKNLGFDNFKVEIGRFNDVLPGILNSDLKYDFVFIDGHHDKDATLNYFDLIFPFLESKSIVIFDDINWSKGMEEAWDKLLQDSKIKFAFDLDKWGICYIDKGQTSERPIIFNSSI